MVIRPANRAGLCSLGPVGGLTVVGQKVGPHRQGQHHTSRAGVTGGFSEEAAITARL